MQKGTERSLEVRAYCRHAGCQPLVVIATRQWRQVGGVHDPTFLQDDNQQSGCAMLCCAVL